MTLEKFPIQELYDAALDEEGRLTVRELFDKMLEVDILPDQKVLTQWREVGLWQLHSLQRLGLEPKHHFLDVGCGSLRLGMYMIPYLHSGHYFGVDAFEPSLKLGGEILRHLSVKQDYKVVHSTEFPFEDFGVTFDFANAQSVFTHLTLIQIERCIAKLQGVMRMGGQFLFTYIPGQVALGHLYGNRQPMVWPGQCDDTFFEKMACKFRLKFEKKDWPHPTGQGVGVFTF